MTLSRDLSNVDDHTRGVERNRRAMLTGSAAALARVVQIGTSLITVPLTLKYLGNERFGLWMTISSVLAMAAFADFGVGNGVLNTVAKAFGQDDMVGVRKAVSSGFAILNSIALILLLLFFSIYSFVNWGGFFRVVSPLAKLEAGPALAVFAVCFALNIAMDVVQRVQLGLQQGYRYGLWQLSGSIAGFIGVLSGIWLHASLPVLVIAIAGAPVIATTLNAIHFFGFVRPELRPDWAFVSRDTISQIARLGGLFFVLQVVSSVAYSADNLIIARTLGVINVPDYAIPQRMFALISMMVLMLAAPLWPAYAEAIARGDFQWIRRTLRKTLLIAFGISCMASLLLLVLAPTLIRLWIGTRIHPPFLLLLGFAIWTVIECTGNTLAVFLNSAAAVRIQITLSVIFAVICVCMKVFMAKHFGPVAIPWSATISWLTMEAVPWVFFVPRLLRKLESQYASHESKGSIEDIVGICGLHEEI
jgi:O-antigen/teichoic acid export membrane protein